jgi:hypothetical protein
VPLRRRTSIASLPLLAAIALPLSGCYDDVDSFVVAKAKQDCKRMRQCHRATFEDNHRGDMGECRSDLEKVYFDLADIAEALGWEYDPDGGKECISVSRKLRNDCSDGATADIAEACDDLADWRG